MAGTANAGTAVFEAVGRFGNLIRGANDAQGALKGVSGAAAGVGKQMPASGGPASTGVKTIGQRAGELADQMDKTGKKMTLGITTPLTLAGGAAVKTFASFETKIVSAGQKAGATTQELADMRALAIDLGAKTKFSAIESADALDQLAAAGLNAHESMGALPAVMLAAQASGEDLARTAAITAQAMNAFNIPADQSSHIADVFAQAANTSALNMAGLGESLAHAGQLGASANQSLEDVVATIANLVNQGVPAAQAGTAVSQAVQSLKTPASTKAANLMKELGIQTRDAAGNMLPLPTLVRNLDKQLSTANPAFREYAKQNKLGAKAARDQALNVFFGVEGMKAMSLSMGNAKPFMLDVNKDTEKMGQLTLGLSRVMGKDAAEAFVKAHTKGDKFVATGADAITAMSAMNKGADGLSKKIGDVFQKTTAQKFDNMIGALQTIAIDLVSSVAPALNALVDGLTTLFDWLDKISQVPWVGPIVIGLGVILAAAGPLLVMLSKIITAFRTVSSLGGRLRKGGAAGGGAGGRGGAARGAAAASALGGAFDGKQEVFWLRAMPVAIAGSTKAPGADQKGGAQPSKPSVTTPAPAAGPSRGRRVAGAVGRAAGAGALAAGVTAAVTGGDLGQAAQVGGIAAGIELATEAAAKGLSKLGPLMSRFGGLIGGMAKGLLTFMGMIPRVVAGWVLMAGQALVQAGRMALAWFIGVARPAAAALGQFLITVGRFVAGWLLMGAQALLGAARVALAWIIAMGPIAIIIAAVIALVALIVLNWDKIKAAIAAGWEWVKRNAIAVWTWITNFLSGIWNGIVNAAKTVWNLYVAFWRGIWNGAVAIVTGAWRGIQSLLSLGWQVIKAVVFDPMKTALGLLVTAFQTTRDGIGRAWEGLKRIAAAPVEFVINTVIIDWLLGGFNKLAGFFGVPPITLQKVSFASGGVMPGYTPGRDVHRFVSPTGGALELSGGEAIMRPEWTRAIGGPGAVAAMNRNPKNAGARMRAAFAAGGVSTLPRSAPGRSQQGSDPTLTAAFADGGVLGWIGNLASNVADWGSDVWNTITNPIGAMKKVVGNIVGRFGSSPFMQMLTGMGNKVVGYLADKVTGLFGGQDPNATGLATTAIQWGRWKVDSDTQMRLNRVRNEYGIPLTVIQGSWSNNPLSMGTHLGAGAVDLRTNDYGAAVKALRAVGMLAMFRAWPGNWHIHALNPHVAGLSPQAQAQVNRARDNGGIFAGGGVFRAAQGGVVPGTGVGDKVKSLLEPGEGVVRKRIMDQIGGARALQALNSGRAGLVPMDMLGMLTQAESARIDNVRALTGVSAGVPTVAVSVAAPPRREGKKLEFHTTIVNPKQETAGDSLQRTYAKVAYLAPDERDD